MCAENSLSMEVLEAMAPLYADLKDQRQFPETRLHLAHYTSMITAENILKHQELWFSSPFYMNDFEEVRFGIENAYRMVLEHGRLAKAFKSDTERTFFFENFRGFQQQFIDEHSHELYVFCLSEHDAEDSDGLLSMWRGYGGNGTGVALVFDTSRIPIEKDTPLLIAPVVYASKEQRIAWINESIETFVDIILAEERSVAWIWYAAFFFYERIKLFAVFTKHWGFREEREWRVAYLPERDPKRRYGNFHSYFIGPRGIEPKFKFKMSADEGSSPLSIVDLISHIVIGPNFSSPMAAVAVKRMVTALGFPQLEAATRSSSIPFR